MYPPNSAQDCFDYLLSTSSSDVFKRNLEHIRKACDEIVNMQGVLSNRKIGNYAQSHFGSPSYSGIRDNPDHKAYISLRKIEQKRQQKPTAKAKNNSATLPRDVDVLQNYVKRQEEEIKTLKKINKGLEFQLKRAILKNPIKSAKSIAAGPQEDGSMTIIHQKDTLTKSTGLTAIALTAIQKLLHVGYDNDSYQEYKKLKEGEKLILSTDSVEKTILNKGELQALRKVIK
jgi:predicted transcriptional regulator